jgi:hypothetical protein
MESRSPPVPRSRSPNASLPELTSPRLSARADASKPQDIRFEDDAPRTPSKYIKDKHPEFRPFEFTPDESSLQEEYLSLYDETTKHLEQVDKVLLSFRRNREFNSAAGRNSLLNDLVFRSLPECLRDHIADRHGADYKHLVYQEFRQHIFDAAADLEFHGYITTYLDSWKNSTNRKDNP